MNPGIRSTTPNKLYYLNDFSWLPLNLMTLSSELGLSWLWFNVGVVSPPVTTTNVTRHGDDTSSPDMDHDGTNDFHSSQIVYGLLQLLGTANACSNPILYGYLNENFFNEYKNIYRR